MEQNSENVSSTTTDMTSIEVETNVDLEIIDFSDIENSSSILPTGQSGNPFSKHYKDQVEMYNKGEFRKMKLNKDEIIRVSTKLTVQPNNE